MLYLTEILGLPVVDSAGKTIGRVAEIAAARPPRVALLVLKNGKGQPARAVPFEEVSSLSTGQVRLRISDDQVQAFQPDESLLYLRKDLLDQQIIDVNGRKVVRVNDLSLEERRVNSRPELRIHSVDIGVGGAARRLFSGVVPREWLRKLETRLNQRSISWEFVDLLEDNPLRRVKLNISHSVLGKLHPADLADIVEELSPKERRAIFQELDNTTAADALSEIEPRLQVSILESLDASRAADILEEMPPDAAADLLADLPEETSSELLHDLPKEEAEELEELLEFAGHSAGGLMTTDHIALPHETTVGEVRQMLANLPERPVNLTTIFLVDQETEQYVGSVPVARLIIATAEQKLVDLKNERRLTISVDAAEREAIEMVDKYNLLALPVLDQEEHLAGVITVDDIVSVLCRRT
jgi:flagellar motility protein MotE (MotC chaperone)/sporulation protein YlmC with PRC-barrel domain